MGLVVNPQHKTKSFLGLRLQLRAGGLSKRPSELSTAFTGFPKYRRIQKTIIPFSFSAVLELVFYEIHDSLECSFQKPRTNKK